MQTEEKQDVLELIQFWQENQANWFSKSDTFDQQFRQRFEHLHWQAAASQLAHWMDTDQGALALLLLLDQFPRNSYRNTGHMYATDSLARFYARQLADRQGDLTLPQALRVFCYLPFTHSEELADHDLAVSLNERGQTGEGLKFALHHRDIVQRYGRFPHRNAILGRTSSAAELAFIESGGFSG